MKAVQERRLIFWDFDGVIKDSVEVKSTGFVQLFLPYGEGVAARVRQHHQSHGGLSRFEKMPLYLQWAGEPATAARVEEFCNQFSQLVMQAVIDSPWVPGVREYLQAHHARQRFALITATPQEEILRILRSVDIAHCFHAVYGAPTPKAEAIRNELREAQCAPEQALVIGDSEADLEAAEANDVTFLLRRTPLNRALRERYCGPTFESLTYE